jgi:hypothetical protein
VHARYLDALIMGADAFSSTFTLARDQNRMVDESRCCVSNEYCAGWDQKISCEIAVGALQWITPKKSRARAPEQSTAAYRRERK